MKQKGFILLAALQLGLASLAHADIVFQSADPNICNTLSNTSWAGQGTVTAMKGALNCTYNGTAHVTDAALTTHTFNMQVNLTKEKGALCPTSESLTLSGTCDNGLLSLKTNEVNLTGNLDSTGTEINNVTGTITFSIPTGKVTANVSNMNLHKTQ